MHELGGFFCKTVKLLDKAKFAELKKNKTWARSAGHWAGVSPWALGPVDGGGWLGLGWL